MIQRIRVPLGFAIAAAVLYFAAPTPASILIGLPIALVGAAFRAMAAGVIKKDSSLATTGPYAWTRNPLYFGSFMLAAGFSVMSNNLVAAALLLVPSVLVYPNVIRNEEAHLARLFPHEFPAYRSKVPCFIPRVGRSAPSFSFQQYVANREYNTALGLIGILAIFVIKFLFKP
jgi:protein-S-isoprenylcysteine O-methyltransferase Ste14